MPLQNRVDPYGRLHAVADRGSLMGNRGVLHDASRRVVAAWRTRRWIVCALSFRGRQREVFAPRRYSELFFLDEATALAAGHRPCAECRRSRYEEFRAAWAKGRRLGGARRPGADEIDRVLHAERAPGAGRKKGYRARLSSLPPGVLVERDGRAFLYREGRLFPWSFAGYGPPQRPPKGAAVRVLTPRSIVGAIREGFTPQVHGSAEAAGARVRASSGPRGRGSSPPARR